MIQSAFYRIYCIHILWKDKILNTKMENVDRKEFTNLSVTSSQQSDVAS